MATNNGHAAEKLRELIHDIKIAMLTTVDDTDGALRSRPMVTQESEFEDYLWFFTASDAPKVDEVQHERDVNLSYVDQGKNRYVSVSGKALLVRDRNTMERFWQPALKAWFPDGLETRDIALLQVKPVKAEYWDAPSGKFVPLAGLVKALATGERYEGEGSENEKLNLR
jgi:general stress protein 26